jgi:DNA-binding transcriptional MerR regulator
MDEVWGIKELAAHLRIPAATVRKWKQRGKLPPADAHAGGRDLWDADTLRRWAKTGDTK